MTRVALARARCALGMEILDMALLSLLILVVVAVLAFKLVGSLLGFAFMLLIAALIGAGADALVPGRLPFGWLGAIAAGLLGAWLGTLLMGSIPPYVAGLPVIPAVVGAVVVALLAELVLKTAVRPPA